VRREGARKGFSKRISCHNRSNELKISAEAHGNFVGSIVSTIFGLVLNRSGQPASGKIVAHERNEVDNFHEFHPHSENWYARRSIDFSGDEFVLCDSLFGAELRIFSSLKIRKNFLYELTTGASVPLGVAAENFAKSTKLGGKNSCQRCANSLTLTRIPLTIPKGQ